MNKPSIDKVKQPDLCKTCKSQSCKIDIGYGLVVPCINLKESK